MRLSCSAVKGALPFLKGRYIMDFEAAYFQMEKL